jgi:L-evernosamine nitrososynthase
VRNLPAGLFRASASLGIAEAANRTANAAAARRGELDAHGRTLVVDRALGLSGGAGYLNRSLLARAYRDVKAGAFMHPLGANRAYEFLADISLGREPALH